MIADRFLTWLFYNVGLDAFDAQRLLTMDERNALLTQWIKSGCPYAVGV